MAVLRALDAFHHKRPHSTGRWVWTADVSYQTVEGTEKEGHAGKSCPAPSGLRAVVMCGWAAAVACSLLTENVGPVVAPALHVHLLALAHASVETAYFLCATDEDEKRIRAAVDAVCNDLLAGDAFAAKMRVVVKALPGCRNEAAALGDFVGSCELHKGTFLAVRGDIALSAGALLALVAAHRRNLAADKMCAMTWGVVDAASEAAVDGLMHREADVVTLQRAASGASSDALVEEELGKTDSVFEVVAVSASADLEPAQQPPTAAVKAARKARGALGFSALACCGAFACESSVQVLFKEAVDVEGLGVSFVKTVVASKYADELGDNSVYLARLDAIRGGSGAHVASLAGPREFVALCDQLCSGLRRNRRGAGKDKEGEAEAVAFVQSASLDLSLVEPLAATQEPRMQARGGSIFPADLAAGRVAVLAKSLKFCYVGGDVTLGEGAAAESAVIGAGVKFGMKADAIECWVLGNVEVGAGATCEPGATLFADVGEGCHTAPCENLVRVLGLAANDVELFSSSSADLSARAHALGSDYASCESQRRAALAEEQSAEAEAAAEAEGPTSDEFGSESFSFEIRQLIRGCFESIAHCERVIADEQADEGLRETAEGQVSRDESTGTNEWEDTCVLEMKSLRMASNRSCADVVRAVAPLFVAEVESAGGATRELAVKYRFAFQHWCRPKEGGDALVEALYTAVYNSTYPAAFSRTLQFLNIEDALPDSAVLAWWAKARTVAAAASSIDQFCNWLEKNSDSSSQSGRSSGGSSNTD